ncbi:unnamed protein product [Brassicogethes aeneus]|uniref:Uncharacterized protein n=1 Tax=Brassicogethes aeneus TaxID=1431903 RepID=A0A9P0FED4_BRAAE|nr:unnamed protein product [Brassicogethes aeneus]
MKYFLVIVVLASVLAVTLSATIENCKCWEGFEAEKEGDDVHCRGTKNHRIFPCDTKKPPTCTCVDEATKKDVVLDLGETACTGLAGKYVSLSCKPEAEWDAWLKEYPQYRLQIN